MVLFSARVQERCKLEYGPFSYYHVKWTAPNIKLLLETWLGLKKKKKKKKKNKKKKKKKKKKNRKKKKRYLKKIFASALLKISRRPTVVC